MIACFSWCDSVSLHVSYLCDGVLAWWCECIGVVVVVCRLCECIGVVVVVVCRLV